MKRIVLCLDGTWNDNRAGSTLTNVAKLQSAIAGSDANGVQQIAHYVDGIASAAGESVQFLKGAVGFGVGDRIRRAYELLAKDYAPGDEIHLFGFSRGAFEARSLAGLITLFGIARSVADFPFDKAWLLYRTRASRRRDALLAEVRAAAHYPVRIRCVGVWDTVGNLGNPFAPSGPIGRMFKFHDTRLSDAIDVGLQALSIDEVRGPFRPTLWTLPAGQALAPHQHVEQVWFAGSHCNVGGGFRESGLSDISLLWMAERASATAGLAFDMAALGRSTRPDPLGPQHRSARGSIFRWSRLIPFIRLVKQAVTAIPAWRRMLMGTWRTTKLRRGLVSINETVHDSVLRRLGQHVIELRDGRSHMMVYRPPQLVPIVAEQPRPDAAKPRRVKVFTVHGTFAHDADWDNWDAKDEAGKASEQRAFINRLSEQLRKRDVTLDAMDHTQYNWSGGNSHDERRTAAIGLKKLIEAELTDKTARHGKDYYDAVYIVGHSHGGTVARLAMNLWDKAHDYYDPVVNAHFDEFKHDDRCETCMRARNGRVGPGTVQRPDGVITFGSPFVTFEQRRWGLLTAHIGAWVFRALSLIPLVVLYAAYKSDFLPGMMEMLLPDAARLGLELGLPLALYWLVASYLPRLILSPAERWIGTGNIVSTLAAALLALKLAVMAGIGVYYIAYVVGGWPKALEWLPFLGHPGLLAWLWWSVPFVVFWLLAITLPGWLMSWMRGKVVALRERLPKKYDPAEDRPVPYLSYLTLGDEARLHLRLFGMLTWLVQTLGLATACVLAFALILMPLIAIEAVSYLAGGSSLLSNVGLSALGSDRVLQDRFITVMDALTLFPSLIWSGLLGYTAELNLGSLAQPHAVAGYIPGALAIAILVIFVLLMPIVLILLGVAYLVSMRLRGSGLVFGSEKFAWTMANHITITPRANQNTALRRPFLAADAWWRRDYAHCFYYKSDRVIDDVARSVADWSQHRPTPFWPFGAWAGAIGRWAVVLLFVLSMFALSVPIADALANLMGTKAAPSDGPGQTPEPQLVEEGLNSCWNQPHAVTINRADWPNLTLTELETKALSQWEAEVSARFGADFAVAANGVSKNIACLGSTGCTVSAYACKPRPIDCKPTPHTLEIGFELATALDAEIRSRMAYQAEYTLKERWLAQVGSTFGPEWADDWFNFATMSERRPVEKGCKEEALSEGRTSYQCRVAAAPCRKPDAPPPRGR